MKIWVAEVARLPRSRQKRNSGEFRYEKFTASERRAKLAAASLVISEELEVLDAYADRWALITGASSGIGAAFARLLAARGMHLVLTARREDRLKDLAAELHTRHGTRCEIIIGDLCNPAEPKRHFDEIQRLGINIELLVNNAGFGFVGTIDDTDPARMMKMVQLNIASLTELTYLFIAPMLKREHGGIINLSSIAGFQPVAYMPVYSASKAFVLHFSEALWAEARDRNVTVIGLCPGTTQTEFFDVAGVAGWLSKHRFHSAEYVAKRAIRGLEKGRQYVIPGWQNWLLSLGVRLARRKMVVLQSMKFFRPRPKDDSDPKRLK